MKRIILASGAGLLAVGAISVSAASLGGITSKSVGVDSQVIAPCDSNGINSSYGYGYSASLGTYEVTSVQLSNVDAACSGLSYSLTLADDAKESIGVQSGVLNLTSGSTSITIPSGTSGKAVTRVAVAISG